MSVQGVSGNVPQQGPQQPDPVKHIENVIESAVESMQEATRVFDTEVQGVSKNQLPKYNAKQGNDTMIASERGKAATYMPNIDAEKFEALSNMPKELDAIRKKKKKPGAFEEHLEELSALEGTLDDTSLNVEEKGLIAEFFDNLSRIKSLRARLKQLKAQQKHYEDQQEQQKKKQALLLKNQQEQQKLKDQQQGS